MQERLNLKQLTDEELVTYQSLTGANLRRSDIDQFPAGVQQQWRERIAEIDAELLRRWKKRSKHNGNDKRRGRR